MNLKHKHSVEDAKDWNSDRLVTFMNLKWNEVEEREDDKVAYSLVRGILRAFKLHQKLIIGELIDWLDLVVAHKQLHDIFLFAFVNGDHCALRLLLKFIINFVL